MDKKLLIMTVVAFVLTAILAPQLQAGTVNVSLGAGTAGIEGYRLVTTGGVTARLQRVDDVDDGKPALRLTFIKSGEERRLVALEGQLKGNPSAAKALAVRCRMNLVKGQLIRFALVVFETDGEIWFKVKGSPLTPAREFSIEMLPLGALKRAAFSIAADGQLQWEKVEKLWLGLVIDGVAEGSFEVSDVYFTTELYKASKPLIITSAEQPGVWSVNKDPAVQAKLTTPNDGPGGKPCLKFEFTFPAQLHMFALPTITLPSAELDGYSGLRFVYKANLPAGNEILKGLLVQLVERDGSSYYADPMPPPSEDWKQITLPFDRFKLGSWSRDENQQLDLDQVLYIIIGVHGTALEASSGTIWATDIEFVP